MFLDLTFRCTFLEQIPFLIVEADRIDYDIFNEVCDIFMNLLFISLDSMDKNNYADNVSSLFLIWFYWKMVIEGFDVWRNYLPKLIALFVNSERNHKNWEEKQISFSENFSLSRKEWIWEIFSYCKFFIHLWKARNISTGKRFYM